jgi:hypothetical protein
VEIDIAFSMATTGPKALPPMLGVVEPSGRDVIGFVGRSDKAEGAERRVEVGCGRVEVRHTDWRSTMSLAAIAAMEVLPMWSIRSTRAPSAPCKLETSAAARSGHSAR